MPEPLPRASSPPPIWPASLPKPQAGSFTVTGPQRVDRFDPLAGPTRLRVRARTASMEFSFTCHFTQQQMQDFETWYTAVARDNDGEFYARWVGGGRIVAFLEPYAYRALGAGYVLDGHLVRTRIDHRACEAFTDAIFGNLYQDDGIATDVYADDAFTAVDSYVDDFPLALIAANEC